MEQTRFAPGVRALAHVQQVLVQNQTGATRSAGDVLGLGEPIFDLGDEVEREEWSARPAFAGLEPDTPDHLGRFVILADRVYDDELAWAWSIGAELVTRVYVHEEGHRFADVADGEHEFLDSVEAGGAEILGQETGVGLKWALVRLIGRQLHSRWVRLPEPLEFDDEIAADVLTQATNGALGDAGRPLLVRCPFLKSGRQLATDTTTKAEFDWDSGLWNVDRVDDCDEPIPA